MKEDIDIAREVKLQPIEDIGAKLGLEDLLLPFGCHKAKVAVDQMDLSSRKGKMILVTAMSPTPAGEGKTTMAIGLSMALNRLGKNAVVGLREPSLGPVFGIKGGAAGHDFSAVLSDTDVWDLVKFVKTGTIDMGGHINLATKAAQGNAVLGGPLYDNSCIGCHGYTGRMIDFDSDPGSYEGVGDLSNGNPWETLHKIRWGHPGSAMPSMVTAGLSETDHGDLLAYAQTLGQGAALSYAANVHPLWGALTCTNCHTGAAPAGGLDLSGAAVATLGLLQNGTRINPNAVASLILTKPLSMLAGGVLHGGGDLFANTSDVFYRTILQWLEEGEAP